MPANTGVTMDEEVGSDIAMQDVNKLVVLDGVAGEVYTVDGSGFN